MRRCRPALTTMPYCSQSAEILPDGRGGKTRKDQRRSDGFEEASAGDSCRTGPLGRHREAQRFARFWESPQKPSSNCHLSGATGCELATAVPRAGEGFSVGSASMSSMGVTPANGSFTNMPNFKETAPTSLPSI